MASEEFFNLHSDSDGDAIMKIVIDGQMNSGLFFAASKGLFDALHALGSAHSAEDIAVKTGFLPELTKRLLKLMANLKLVIEEKGDQGIFLYRNAPAATKYLRRSLAVNMVGAILLNTAFYQSSVQPAKGTEGKCCDFNDLLPEDYKDATKTNMQMFHGLAMYCMDALCQVTDFSKYKHIVDLGGGSGYIAREIAKRNGNIKVTVFDTPKVAGSVMDYFPPEPSEDVTFQGGDFLKDDLPKGDLFILSHVLNCSSTQRVKDIVNPVFQVLPTGGSMLVLDMMPRVDNITINENVLMSMFGAENATRSFKEYQDIFGAVGFIGTELKEIRGCNCKDAILTHKEEIRVPPNNRLLFSDPDGDLIMKIMTEGANICSLMYALTNGMFDSIANMELMTTVENIAKSTNIEIPAATWLLKLMEHVGLVVAGQTEQGILHYRNSESTSKYLLKSKTPNMIDAVIMDTLWFQLIVQAADGKGGEFEGEFDARLPNGYQEGPDKDIQLFTGLTVYCIEAICQSGDFSQYKHIVDLGGSSGYVAREIAKRNGNMKVTVVDLPEVCKVAAEIVPPAPPENVTFLAGDYFKDPLPEGDLYILGHVLHTMDDAMAKTTLDLVSKALTPGGTMMVIEKAVRDEDGNDFSLAMDLFMSIVCTGGERTIQEYEALFSPHGFTGTTIRPIRGMNVKDVIFSYKPIA